MPLINCEINVILTWLAKLVLCDPVNHEPTFTTTDIKLFLFWL